MNFSQEYEAELLRLARERGGTVRQCGGVNLGPAIGAPIRDDDKKPAVLVQPSVFLHRGGDRHKLVLHIPVETTSEINGRQWKARNRRSGAAWKAVSRLLGPSLALLAEFGEAYAANSALRVLFVRLGGRRLDHSNLPTATKAVEDAVAYMLGVDDGDPRWHPEFQQEPGGAVGVRVEIEVHK